MDKGSKTLLPYLAARTASLILPAKRLSFQFPAIVRPDGVV